MKKRSRATLVTTAVLVVVAALLFLFYYLRGVDTPSVALPGNIFGDDGQGDVVSGQGDYLQVEITTENVQQVIAALTRTDSYSRTLVITRAWGEGEDEQAEETVEVYSTPAGIRVNVENRKQFIVAGDNYFVWDAGGESYNRLPITGVWGDTYTGILDELAGVPSYERVLALDGDRITGAGYSAIPLSLSQRSEPCIYVAYTPNGGETVERYYISIATGLLVAAETYEDGLKVYGMEERNITLSAPGDSLFQLPDGTDARQN